MATYNTSYDKGANIESGQDRYRMEMGMSDAEREKDMVARKGSMIGEGAVMYGDVATAEQYGYVERGYVFCFLASIHSFYLANTVTRLKSRHIQFIALGGTIGTGLFVGIGKALYTSGPLAVLLGYTIVGLFIYMMMMSLVSSVE